MPAFAYCYISCRFFLNIRLPPGSTRTSTRFPYTTLFRSEDCLPIHSLRRSRAAHDGTWLSRTLASVGLELPEAPRAQSGNATRACVHIEPNAWLMTGHIDVPPGGNGWLHTEQIGRASCRERVGPYV